MEKLTVKYQQDDYTILSISMTFNISRSRNVSAIHVNLQQMNMKFKDARKSQDTHFKNVCKPITLQCRFPFNFIFYKV